MNHALLSHETESAEVSRIQASSLKVNQPEDSYEREADRVAETVSKGGSVATRLPVWSLGGTVQRQSATPGQASGAQPAPIAPTSGDAVAKIADAALKTKAVQDMITRLTENDPLVKAGTEFVKTPEGIVVAGAAATGVIATLAATHRPLPVQIPAIPLSIISSRLADFKLQISYHGPVDHPTDAMITLSYAGKSDQKKNQTDPGKYRAETARLAADQEKFREGLQPKSGPLAEQKKTEDQWFQNWSLRRAGLLPGSGWGLPGKQDSALQPAPPSSGAPTADKKPTVPASAPPVTDVPKKKEELPVQRKAASNAEADYDSADVRGTVRSNGRPLDRATRGYMEARIGFDFGRVRVHTDEQAAISARSMGALAYTVGSHVVFARGAYAPDTAQGRRLLAHELTHVVQQSPGPRPVAAGSAPIAGAAPRRIQRWPDILSGIKEKVLAKLREVPGYNLFAVILGKDPISGDRVERTPTNLTHGVLELVPGGDDAFKRMQESGAIDRAYAWLTAEIDKLGFSEEYFIGLLQEAKDALGFDFDAAWNRIKEIFRRPYEKLKSFASAVLNKVLDIVLEAALEAIGGKEIAAQIMDFFRKAGTAIKTIINDPAAFLGHLLDAVKKGFGQFSGNILEHLKNGLIEWLFGEIAATGIVLPKKFDIGGIINLVLQVLGITYARFKKKLENLLGEPAVQFLEGALDIVKTIATKGMGAAWDLILEKAGNLFDTVMTSVREWVVTKIVTLAVTHLASLFNPIGGVIESIRVIYETIKFFIDKAKQIGALIKAIVDSISEIAAGNIAKAADWIEATLAKAVPLVLRFLAGLISLGNVGDKVRETIKKLQDKVDAGMDKVLEYIAEKGRQLWAKGKETYTYVAEWWKAKRPFKLGEEEHTLSIEGDEDHPQVMVASSAPTTLQIFLDNVSATKEEKQELTALAKKIKLRKKKVEEKDKAGNDGEANFNLLLEKISKLKSSGGEKVPKSQVGPQQVNSLGGGEGVDAFLSLDHPVGTAPERVSKPAVWEDLGPELQKRKSYVRGHLLSQRLGGQGVWKNMMPITNSANQTMFNAVEDRIIKVIGTGKTKVHYKVKANYKSLAPATTPEVAEQRLGKVQWEWSPATFNDEKKQWEDVSDPKAKDEKDSKAKVEVEATQ
jgi:hypothetical protein